MSNEVDAYLKATEASLKAAEAYEKANLISVEAITVIVVGVVAVTLIWAVGSAIQAFASASWRKVYWTLRAEADIKRLTAEEAKDGGEPPPAEPVP